MEQLLFYHYRNFQRKLLATFGEKLKRIPVLILLLFVAVVASIVIGLISLFWGLNMRFSIIAVVSEVVFALAFYAAVENYSIKNSRKQMERYWEYCTQLKNNLADVGVYSQQDIEEIKGRLEKQAQQMRDERRASNAFWGKLGEITAVPVILSIITAAINQRDNIGEMLAMVILVLLAAGVLFATVVCIVGLVRFPKKNKLEQMMEFIDDLQGVLDLERFHVNADGMETIAK